MGLGEGNSGEGPTDRLAIGDPGDQTQRNFRYQHAYGAILLLAGARGDKPFEAVWCEQHEDLLCERTDGLFDGYQVKTRKPENGAWKTNDPEFVRSVRRFAALIKRFPDVVRSVSFVSNADFFVTSSGDISKSPVALLEAVRGTSDVDSVPSPFKGVLTTLADAPHSDAQDILVALQRMELILGPPRDGFDAEIAHRHLPAIPVCASLSASRLDEIKNELIEIVYLASSLTTGSPATHLTSLSSVDRNNPLLRAKRVDVFKVLQVASRAVPFRYLPTSSPLTLGAAGTSTSILRIKLEKGGIGEYADELSQQGLSAEQHLIEFSHRNPEQAPAHLSQLEGVVLSEYIAASAEASLTGEPFGRRLLSDLFERLRRVATDTPNMVGSEPYQCLQGVACLLSGECKVWWSQQFEITKP